jgi:hypothetical protein
MVLIVSEFVYDGKDTVLPFVVGPSLLESYLKEVPHGVAITDTVVAGLHPYTGGKLAITIVLARVRRSSYAKQLLQFIEGVATAFPLGAAIQPHLKVARALIDAVDGLLSMTDTELVAGHRWEYNDGITPWLVPGYFALIARDEKEVDSESLKVVNGRLQHGDDHVSEFRESDFVLYSLRALDRRRDFRELPFYDLQKQALVAAASPEDGSWERAKANLVAVYQQMLSSPDLTFSQAHELASNFKQDLVKVHDLKGSLVLGHPPDASEDRAGAGGVRFAQERKAEMRKIHSLLEL